MVEALAKDGVTVTTQQVESVKEGADAERVIRDLVAKGNNVIFTTSFGFMDPTLKVAQTSPKTMFYHATGYKNAPNMGTYEARTYESSLFGWRDGGQNDQIQHARLCCFGQNP